MEKPLVSIVIPVYNGANYLKSAIDSAISQTYKNIEILVINDGSCDGGETERIALFYRDKIRYFYKENGGVASALNLGIEEMKGDYFSWLSHDDMYYPNKVERQIQALDENNDKTALVYSAFEYLNAETSKRTPLFSHLKYSKEQLQNSVFPVLDSLVYGCALLIHKSHFERVGTFNEKLLYTQDNDLWFRMFRNQKSIYIPESLALYRVHSEQSCRTIPCFEEWEQLYINYINNLTEVEIQEMFSSTYYFYYKMCYFAKKGAMTKFYRHANRKFQEAEIPENVTPKLYYFGQFIKELSDGKANRICIFCAGRYGELLSEELYCRLISVDSYCDNNPQKWGKRFNYVNCIDPNSLEEQKDNTLVIVATKEPTEIVNQLRVLGYPYITTKQEIDPILLETPPIKWITSLNEIDSIIDSVKEIQVLKDIFNKKIFDMCKYYEDRLARILEK